jgi:branched-chain amino acid transport system substrate-binding protein
VEIVAVEPYDATVTDFTSLLKTVNKKQPTALFVAGYGEQALVLRDAHRLNLQIVKFASPSFENPDIVAQAGVAAENVIYPNYFDRENPSAELLEFMRQYEARFHEPAEAFSASAFVGMQLVLHALNGCDTPEAGCIRRQLQHMETTVTILGPTTIDEVGDIRYPIFLKTVRNGQFVRLK